MQKRLAIGHGVNILDQKTGGGGSTSKDLETINYTLTRSTLQYGCTVWRIHFRCSPREFSATCSQQVYGSAVVGLSQTAISGPQ